MSQTKESERDDRFDLFRGLALIGITLNHTTPALGIFEKYGHFQFRTGFFFNFADVFVFISGCVAGIVYWKISHKLSFLQLQKKAGLRALEISLYNALACVLCLLIVVLFSLFDIEAYRHHTDTSNVISSALKTIFYIEPISYFNILGLYVVFLLLLPGFVFLYKKNWLIPIGLSILVYAFAQFLFYSKSQYPLFTNLPFFGNPIGWQMAFFSGVTIGILISNKSLRLPPLSKTFPFLAAYFLLGMFMQQQAFAYFYFSSERYLGLLRILDLLLIAYFISQVIPKSLFSTYTFTQPFVALGRNSLPIFALSLVICYLMSFVLIALGAFREVYITVILLEFALLYGLGLGLAKSKRLSQLINIKISG